MQDLKGKSAVVTGASRGIGREIAAQLAARGADVAINYRSSDTEANEVAEAIRAQGGQALVIQADISEPEQARTLIRQVHDVRDKRNERRRRFDRHALDAEAAEAAATEP